MSSSGAAGAMGLEMGSPGGLSEEARSGGAFGEVEASGQAELDEGLHEAAMDGRAEKVAELLACGADPRSLDSTGWTALCAAAYGGHVECVRLLAPYGEAGHGAHENPMALKRAAELGWSRCVRALATKASANDKEALSTALSAGETAIMLAAAGGHAGSVEALLPWSDPKEANRSEETLLMMAARSGQAEAVRLLAPLCDASARDRFGRTALMSACAVQAPECVEILLSWCDPRAASLDGETPLMRAAAGPRAEGGLRCVQLLLPVSEPAARDRHGLSALMHAAKEGNVGCVRALLPPQGGQQLAADALGALRLAESRGREEAASLIRAYLLARGEREALAKEAGEAPKARRRASL